MLEWAFIGIVLGAAGTEFLRSKKPELIESVENAAKRVVDSFCSSKPADDQDTEDKEDTEGKQDE